MFQSLKLLICPVTALWLTTPSLVAGLVWDRTAIELEARQGEKQIHTVFSYKNTGNTPVAIIKVEKSCDCIQVTFQTKEIGPQTGGELQIQYTVGTGKGLQRKHFLVATSDQPNKWTKLQITVRIPEAAEGEKNALQAPPSETPNTKVARVREKQAPSRLSPDHDVPARIQ